MKKHYLKLTTIISSSILSYSLVVAPFTSNAAMRPKTPSSPVSSGMNGNSLFKPISPASTTSTPSKLYRPTPLRPQTTKFNPMYDSDADSISSASLKSVNSTISNTSHVNTNNTTITSPQNTNNPSNPRNSKFKLKFTDYALIGIAGMSITGLGLTIDKLVKDGQKKSINTENKPQLNEPVNQN